MWRYLAGLLALLLVLAIYASLGAAVMMAAAPALAARLGSAAQPLGIAVTAVIGLSGLFTAYRLLSWLPGLATGATDNGLAAAWRRTRANRWAFLGFTFWLLFTLAIAGGIGAGAFFAQQSLPQPWVKPASFALIGIIAWLALLFLHTVPAALHRAFRDAGGQARAAVP